MDSADAQAAAELRGRIEGERKAHLEELARRQQLVAGAGAARGMPGPREEAAAPRPAPLPALAPGMKLEVFREVYGECFASRGPVQMSTPDGGAPRSGEMWVMKDDAKYDAACREKHPTLAGQAVLFEGGALVGLAPAASAKRTQVVREVELAPLPDGGMGERVDGGVVPLPPGAEIILDGGRR
jgi:hypothetical protein